METHNAIFNKYVHYDSERKIYSITNSSIYIGFYRYKFVKETEHTITIQVKGAIIDLYKKIDYIHIAII